MTKRPVPGANLPLAGVRILDFGIFIAAPYAASLLGDMGADVIKVESPKGDPHRKVSYTVWARERCAGLLARAAAGERKALEDALAKQWRTARERRAHRDVVGRGSASEAERAARDAVCRQRNAGRGRSAIVLVGRGIGF